MKLNFRDSIVVSISACHAEDPGSIPGRGISALHGTSLRWLRCGATPVDFWLEERSCALAWLSWQGLGRGRHPVPDIRDPAWRSQRLPHSAYDISDPHHAMLLM